MELPPEFGDSPGQPCPACQATLRAYSLTAESGNYSVGGGCASLVHTRPGLQSTAQADDRGGITLTATGPGPRNEDDASEICARLVRTLNQRGNDWSDPVVGKQDIDGYSTNSAGEELRMQVVRASNSRALWHKLHKEGSATIEYNPSAAASELSDAIRKKSGKYPAEQKQKMSLVLDAARTPSHTFQRVLDEFRERHREECQNSGFLQVWIVGPQDTLVERLDR